MGRKSTWTTNDFSRCEQNLEGQLDALADDDARLTYLLHELGAATALDEASILRTVALGILALETHGRTDGMTRSDARKLAEDTELLLKSHGITPGSSRLSFLYGRIAKTASLTRWRQGQTLSAAAHVEIARHLSYRPTESASFDDCMLAGELQLRLGHASLAIANAMAALTMAPSLEAGKKAKLLQIKSLRLSGSTSGARRLLRETNLDQDTWEVLVSGLQDAASAGAAAARIFRQRGAAFETLLMTKLWLAAGRSKTTRLSAPKTQNIKRRQQLDNPHPERTKLLSDVAQALDDAYDNMTPLARRLRDAADACTSSGRLPCIEAELLVLAAAYRHALHYRQGDLAQLYLAEYQGISLRLSSGQSRDVLTLGDPAERPTSGPAHGFDRAAIVAKSVGQVALISASSKVKRLWANEEEKKRLAEQKVQALSEVLFDRLSELKGGLMKVGQYVSNIDGLPQEFGTTLALLRHSAEPISALAVERVLAAGLADPTAAFTDWLDEPVAVASIGQIHRARLRDSGREVAVKVQHPGIKAAILSDLSGLGFLRPILQRWLPATDIKGMLAELAARLTGETDFLKEAEVQAHFKHLFATSDDVVIPTVYPAYSSATVITMDFIDGQRFEEFMAQSTQDQRNQAGVIIARTHFTALFRFGLFNCDPHPGNYLFLPDGRVAFLDFGCSREWPPAFVKRFFVDVFKLLLADDFNGFVTLCEELGYNKSSGKFNFKAHWELVHAMYQPLLTHGPTALDRDYMQRLNALHTQSPNLKTASPPPAALMLLRVTFGLLNVLVELGSVADWRGMALAALAAEAGDDDGAVTLIKGA